MLTLYHTALSSNAQRVRLVLAEKDIEWESVAVGRDDLQSPVFRAVSPNGVVPALVHEGRALVDSVVINEYLEDLFPTPALRPTDPYARARMRNWTKHADDYLQRPIAVLTHALVRRPVVLAEHGGDVDRAVAGIVDPIILGWRRDVYAHGLASLHVAEAMRLILASLPQIQQALSHSDWLAGGAYSLAEAAVVPAIFRLDSLALAFLWQERYPAIQPWLDRIYRRQAFERAVRSYVSPAAAQRFREAGLAKRPALKKFATQ